MSDLLKDSAPPDSGLVRAAQAGDAASLGLLLARHRADMYATAVAVLGYASDAEDAVQDATIIALRRIGDVRDPNAVGPWLRAVVRNTCLAKFRKTSAIPVGNLAWMIEGNASDRPLDPAEVLDRHALGDWIWSALEELTPGLRLVMLLRYFTDVTSYEEIAALCGTPVGTVRSRLSQARKKLAEALLNTADGAHNDARALNALHCGLAAEAMASIDCGDGTDRISGWLCPAAEVTWPTGKHTDVEYLNNSIDRDMSDGVRFELLNVVASRDVVIWETVLHNPPEDPLHCPPGVVWLHHLDRGRIRKIRLYHPPGHR